MRILRARVPSFGPLRDVELDLSEGLNLVYGRNEAGKTTLLDFLLAHLFRWERRRGTRLETVLGGLRRFGDAGEAGGSVELRLGEEVHRYPEAPSLLHQLELEHAALTGLFCVRSGELELPHGGGDFWEELKKVLSGLPRGLETLRARAHELGRLTPTGKPSDRGSPGPKTLHAELVERIDELEGLADRLPEAEDLAEEISELERRREELERARRARVAELSRKRDEAVERLAELPRPAAGPLERWREAVEERERLRGKLEDLREELRERRDELERREEARAVAEREAATLRGRVDRAEEQELAERARRLTEPPVRGAAAAGPGPGPAAAPEEAAPEEPSRPTGGALLTAGLRWGGGALLALGLMAAFFTPSETLSDPRLLALLLAALAVGAGALLWARRRLAHETLSREKLEAERHELREAAAACGLDVDSAEEIPDATRRLEREAGEAEMALARLEAREEAARERIEEEEKEIEEVETRLESLDRETEALAEELGFERLADAEDAAEKRGEAEAERERIEASLTELAGADPSGWIGPSREDGDPKEGDPEEWDPAEAMELRERLEELRERYRELDRSFGRAGLSTPEDVLTELAGCRRELREIELDWEAGRTAGRIFDGMDESLEARLRRALSADGPLSAAGLLHRVTGRYVELRREDDGSLAVLDEEGRAYGMEELSRGTRDQIYVAVRVGLAGAALDAAGIDEGGFLLLDDAFLTADWERRGRLVAAAADLSEKGWQVVYLTCDDHLRDLFLEAGAELHEL